MITHFLPMRELITDSTQHSGTTDIAATTIWGPWLIQGYAWITGWFSWTTAGAPPSSFTIFQGYEDRAAIPAPPVPAWGQWLHTNVFNLPGAATTVVPFKVNVLSEGAYFSAVNLSGAAATWYLTAYLRND